MIEQELVNLGYKIVKKRDVLAIEFESEVLNGLNYVETLISMTKMKNLDLDLLLRLGCIFKMKNLTILRNMDRYIESLPIVLRKFSLV